MPLSRVLIVEDEALLAETLCDLIEDAGCEPVGPSATVALALSLIERTRIDVALVDIRLMSETSFPVAYALRQRDIPLIFLTSYQRHDLPADLGDAILVEKPFSPPLLIGTMRRLISSSSPSSRAEPPERAA
jgi:DNA-binding response OmpR family regulator